MHLHRPKNSQKPEQQEMAKRAAPPSPETSQSPKDHLNLKRFKAEVDTPPTHELELLGEPVNNTASNNSPLADDPDSWTKVEKRKAKKARKIEAKLDVSIGLSLYYD